MKKLVVFTGVLALATIAYAGPVHSSVQLLNCQSLMVSNGTAAATGGGGYTNLLSPTCSGWQTNSVNLKWTNHQGIVQRSITSVNASKALLAGDVELNGSPHLWVVGAVDTNNVTLGPYMGNISVTIGPSSASAVGTIQFVPLPDGANESSTTTERFTFTITPSTTADVTLTTNLLASQFVGMKTLRLLSYTIANGSGYTNLVKSITYNSFRDSNP